MNPLLIKTLRENLGAVLTPDLAQSIAVAAFDPPNPVDVERWQPFAVGKLDLRAERFAPCVAELVPLHEAHWQETERYRHGLELRPDYAAMIQDDIAGRLILFTVRDRAESGRLVGNSSIYLHRSRHTNDLIATEDTLFLMREYRGGTVARRLVDYIEGCLISLGVVEARVSSKTENGAHKFMQRAGYSLVAYQLSKMLVKQGERHVQ